MFSPFCRGFVLVLDIRCYYKVSYFIKKKKTVAPVSFFHCPAFIRKVWTLFIIVLKIKYSKTVEQRHAKMSNLLITGYLNCYEMYR